MKNMFRSKPAPEDLQHSPVKAPKKSRADEPWKRRLSLVFSRKSERESRRNSALPVLSGTEDPAAPRRFTQHHVTAPRMETIQKRGSQNSGQQRPDRLAYTAGMAGAAQAAQMPVPKPATEIGRAHV